MFVVVVVDVAVVVVVVVVPFSTTDVWSPHIGDSDRVAVHTTLHSGLRGMMPFGSLSSHAYSSRECCHSIQRNASSNSCASHPASSSIPAYCSAIGAIAPIFSCSSLSFFLFLSEVMIGVVFGWLGVVGLSNLFADVNVTVCLNE